MDNRVQSLRNILETIRSFFMGLPATLCFLLLVPTSDAADLVGRASVIDADTIEIHNQRVRLHGIDALESAQTCLRDGKEWRCGQAAALALSDWLGAATVSCVPVDRDRYQRIVARCSKAGQDVAGWLVSNGWALDWPLYSGGAYVATQDDAKRAKRGVWNSTFQPPWEWRSGRQ